MGRLCCSRYERDARQCGWQRVAGIDEAGRGSLFGPVFAAAVILNLRRRIVGLDDSKKLTAERRAELAERIRERALAWRVTEIDASRIDAWNIYQASRQAMTAAVSQLNARPDYLLMDAMEIDLPLEQKALINGDARSVFIAAASILAKRNATWHGTSSTTSYPNTAWRNIKVTGPPSIWRPCGPRAFPAAPFFLCACPSVGLLGFGSKTESLAAKPRHRHLHSLDDSGVSRHIRPPHLKARLAPCLGTRTRRCRSDPVKSRHLASPAPKRHCYRLWHLPL